MEVYAYHGVSAEERVIGHRYCIDLELVIEGKADSTDRVEDTVDYGALALLAEKIVRESQSLTVERVASVLCDEILRAWPQTHSVEVTLQKIAPPMAVIAAGAGVRIRAEGGERRDERMKG